MTVVCKLGLLLFFFSDLVAAQYVVGAKAGTVQLIVGNVYLDEQKMQKTPFIFPVLKDQQTLRTGRGRVELLLAPGVFLRLGQHSALRMLDNRLENTLLSVRKGRALVEVVELVKDAHIQIECGEARTEFNKTGLYRFDADAGDLQVFAGEAEVLAGGQPLSITRNRRAGLKGTIGVSPFHKSADALYKWATLRSFELFEANLASNTAKKPTNWVYTALGWFWNPDYGAQAAARGSMMKYLPVERDPRFE
jgi:hypothetical protein